MINKTITTLLILTSTLAFSQTNPKTRIQYGWDNNVGEWYFQLKNDHEYFNGNDSVIIATSEYDFNLKDWDNREKATIVFRDINGQKFTSRNFIDRWDMTGKKYTPYSKMDNTISAVFIDGKNYFFQKYSTIQGYDVASGEWDTLSHSNSAPNINGLVASTTTQIKFNGPLMNHDKSQFTYTNTGEISSEWKYDWINNSWVENEAISYKYDFTTGLLSEETYLNYDPVKKYFAIPNYHFLYTYNTDDNLTRTDVEVYDTSTKQYTPNARITNTWNSKNQLTETVTEVYNSTSMQYVNYLRVTYDYDDNTSIATLNDDWFVAPNPCHGTLHIELKDAVSYKLICYNGSELTNWNVDPASKSHVLDLSQTPAGVYFLKATLSNGSQTVKKLIVN